MKKTLKIDKDEYIIFQSKSFLFTCYSMTGITEEQDFKIMIEYAMLSVNQEFADIFWKKYYRFIHHFDNVYELQCNIYQKVLDK